MAKRKMTFSFGEYYHLYNRGNSKQTIFHNKSDYERFIYLLYVCNSIKNFEVRKLDETTYSFDRLDNLVSIGAYVLMPNHFHILVTEKIEGGISKFMQKLSTAYSMYYNKKYNRTGTLFEGRFKSKHLDTDNYLKYVFSYIHLNPVKLIDKDWKEGGIKNKEKAFDYLGSYRYSSFVDYLDVDRPEVVILDRLNFPDYFPKKDDFKAEIFDWFSYKDNI
jgi:putative transposase